MKISQLQNILEEIRKKHDDIDIWFNDPYVSGYSIFNVSNIKYVESPGNDNGSLVISINDFNGVLNNVIKFPIEFKTNIT